MRDNRMFGHKAGCIPDASCPYDNGSQNHKLQKLCGFKLYCFSYMLLRGPSQSPTVFEILGIVSGLPDSI